MYLGIDCGSVSIKLALVSRDGVTSKVYLKNQGLINTIKQGLTMLDAGINGVGITGSGKEFVRAMVGGDIVESEIIAHMVACLKSIPEARTILDIGGEDSKLILIDHHGDIRSFQMNQDCVLPTDEVITEAFVPKQIKHIEIGDYVLSHLGKFRQVTRVITREHDGPIFSFDCGSMKLNVTANHPLLAVKRKDILCYISSRDGVQACNINNECHKSCRKKESLDFKPRFVLPIALSKGDYLVQTVSLLTGNANSFNPIFLRLLGYYLAEGNIEYNRPRTKRDGGIKRKSGLRYEAGVTFCFHTSENALIQDALDIIRNEGFTPFYKPSKNHRGIIKVYSSKLAKQIKHLCGEYSHQKQLNPELFELDKRSLLHLLYGLFKGDGHLAITSRKRSLILKTVSKVLASQVSYILLANGIKNTITSHTPKGKKIVYMVNLHGGEINKLFPGSIVVNRRNHPRLTNYGYLTQIKSITAKHYHGSLYNLTVDGDNTYVCNRLAVHNCGGGTGAMIESIASRLGVKIEDVGRIALESNNPCRFPGKCGIFCQSAVVSELNKGRPVADILMGVCRALVGNYLAVLARAKKLESPIVFQGAPAKNQALVKCFSDILKRDIIVPPNCEYMGAIGAAYLTQEQISGLTNFKGIDNIVNASYRTTNEICQHCENNCELLSLWMDDKIVGRSGSRCGKNNL